MPVAILKPTPSQEPERHPIPETVPEPAAAQSAPDVTSMPDTRADEALLIQAMTERGPSITTIVKVSKLLDDYFDQAKGEFSNGWSDRRISEELKISVNAVIRIREEAFGRLRRPEEVIELARDLSSLSTEMASLNTLIESKLIELDTEIRHRHESDQRILTIKSEIRSSQVLLKEFRDRLANDLAPKVMKISDKYR